MFVSKKAQLAVLAAVLVFLAIALMTGSAGACSEIGIDPCP